MTQDRRSFIKTGSITLAFSGIVPAFLQACKSSRPGENILSDLTTGVVPVNDADYTSRQEKARRLLLENNMDALWIEGGVNLQYFFDVSWWMSERIFGVVLPLDGDPVWICPEFEGPRAEEVIRFGNDIRLWAEHESPYALLGDIFKSLPAGAVRIAIDPNMRNFVVEGLKRETSVELLDGSTVINWCRGIKNKKELGYMDLANTITKKAYQWAFDQIQAGITFSNEPGIYIYDEFGIRIEDCFYVTEGGGEFLGGMLSNSLEDPFGT